MTVILHSQSKVLKKKKETVIKRRSKRILAFKGKIRARGGIFRKEEGNPEK